MVCCRQEFDDDLFFFFFLFSLFRVLLFVFVSLLTGNLTTTD